MTVIIEVCQDFKDFLSLLVPQVSAVGNKIKTFNIKSYNPRKKCKLSVLGIKSGHKFWRNTSLRNHINA